MPDWINILLRSLFALAYLFLLAKVIGKRQIRQVTYIEYIVGITFGSIAAFIATDLEGNLVHGIIALTVFGLFPIVTEWLSIKSKRLRDFFEGRGTVLIKHGKVMEDSLKQERLTIDDLLEQLRAKNVFKVADVEFAVMEPSGEISVLLKAENQPLTAKKAGLSVAPVTEPQTVIMDGVIMDEPLATVGLSRSWLKTELTKIGVAQENVFLGQVDETGQLYLDLYDDKIQVPPPQTDKLTFAELKKCQADLELFALSTQTNTAKKQYEMMAGQLQDVIDQVKPLLTR
ncbi:DUF421 domain-containing protein [Brevibacillus humidisoli]|uniref:DUF421 domain-containing protein n=1 Tax=Brevibacillus humidisoli TaxID=2895522 RepID=UPI001E3E08C7|nr:DUF421 domain-containing protein [Brevibacillus humidisoli]UFJ43183.1 DUF421 domain-containing protein [Brevibacillus humidisoli]